jgi:hypothetical protein
VRRQLEAAGLRVERGERIQVGLHLFLLVIEKPG